MSDETDSSDKDERPFWPLDPTRLEEGVPKPGGRCAICSSELHRTEEHPQRGAPPAGSRCPICGSENHGADQCPQRPRRSVR